VNVQLRPALAVFACPRAGADLVAALSRAPAIARREAREGFVAKVEETKKPQAAKSQGVQMSNSHQPPSQGKYDERKKKVHSGHLGRYLHGAG